MPKEREVICRGPAYQAFIILTLAFTVAPIIAGVDKFLNFLTFWEIYLSQPFDLFKNPVMTMKVVGAIEILAGIGVAFKPKFFANIVALWLLAIVINLILLGDFFDIALRDLGLILCAFSLARLSLVYDCGLFCGHKK